MKKMLVLVAASAVLFAGCEPFMKHSSRPPRSENKPAVKQSYAAKGFSIPSLDASGGTINLADYKGKVVLLDFWATWCPPCRSELPALNRMYDELKSKDFVLIGMTVDQGSIESVKKAVAKFNVTYPMGLAGADAQSAYGGIRAVPTKFLLDKNGDVKQRYVGVVSDTKLKAAIEQLLSM